MGLGWTLWFLERSSTDSSDWKPTEAHYLGSYGSLSPIHDDGIELAKLAGTDNFGRELIEKCKAVYEQNPNGNDDLSLCYMDELYAVGGILNDKDGIEALLKEAPIVAEKPDAECDLPTEMADLLKTAVEAAGEKAHLKAFLVGFHN